MSQFLTGHKLGGEGLVELPLLGARLQHDCRGRGWRRAATGADGAAATGKRLMDRDDDGGRLDGTGLRIACLLYTSPSPRD